MARFPWLDDPNDDKNKKVDTPKFELPDDVKQDIEGNKTRLTSIEEKLKGLDSITAFIEEQRAEKEAAKNKKSEPIQDPTKELTAEQLRELMETDPQSAINLMMSNRDKVTLQLRADQLKKDILEGDTEKFPYYSDPTIRREINALLSQQSLDAQNNASAIENTYFAVVGRHSGEIAEGKIKNKYASGSGSTGSGNDPTDIKTAGRDKVEIKITPEIEKAARLTGMSTEDYVKELRSYEEIEIV